MPTTASRSIRLAELHDAMTSLDEIIALAARTSEVAQIAALEVNSRRLLQSTWRTMSREATRDAIAKVQAGAGEAAVVAEVDAHMESWAEVVGPRFAANATRIYQLARVAGRKRAQGKIDKPLTYDTTVPEAANEETKKVIRLPINKAPDPELLGAFDTTDAEAVSVLKRNNLFWIGEHYTKNVRNAIASTVREVMIEGGQDRTRAAEALRGLLAHRFGEVSMPTGWRGTQNQYLEALAANAATTARNQGQLRSFAVAGWSYYEIVNPNDGRTCEICRHMDGKIFKTTEGAQLADAVIKAKTPAEVRGIHPWMGLKALKSISPTAGKASRGETSKLAGAGFSLPPFHYRCRCVVDVTDEAPGGRGDDAEEL